MSLTDEGSMKDLSNRVRTALEVYLARGVEALSTLESQGPEEFFEVMQTRDHAFHNFRALEALALQEGFDVARDAEARRLWNDVDRVNRTLLGVMREAEARLGERLGRLKAGKAHTQAYLSGRPRALKLIKQV